MSSTSGLPGSGETKLPTETLQGVLPGEGGEVVGQTQTFTGQVEGSEEPLPSRPIPDQDRYESPLPSATKDPIDPKSGATQDDIDLDNNVFGGVGYNSNTKSAAIKSDALFAPTVGSLNNYLKTGSDVDLKEFQNNFKGMEICGDWLMMLFEVFKESKHDTLKNQKYWLRRLEERNKINDAIQKYMSELVEAAQKLNKKVKSCSDSQKDKQTVRVKQRNFDVGPQAQATDANGWLVTPEPTSSKSKSLTREDLNNLIKDVDMMSTRARNERDKIKGFFQGWQEKAKQNDQQLTSILRIMKDLFRVGVGGSDLGAS